MSTFKMPTSPVEAYQRGILANAQADREGVERNDDLQDEMSLMWAGTSERGRENMQLSGSILNESFTDPLSYLTPENYMEHLSIRQDELRLQRERKQLDERYRRAGLYPGMQRLLMAIGMPFDHSGDRPTLIIGKYRNLPLARFLEEWLAREDELNSIVALMLYDTGIGWSRINRLHNPSRTEEELTIGLHTDPELPMLVIFKDSTSKQLRPVLDRAVVFHCAPQDLEGGHIPFE